ncbi:MAG: hypothetical protein K6G84_05245 [Lachnospiraceae bacterium]|nr:hypothetical protein [Lachnospiraceae bacterium]
MKKSHLSLLSVIMPLCMVITIMTYVLGCMMYRSNLRQINQSLMDVRLTDFIENINYGVHFGKRISTYYGMEKEMQLCVDENDNVEALFIIDFNSNTIFATESRDLPNGIKELSNGNFEKDDKLFCISPLLGDARIVSISDASELQKQSREYNYRLLIITVIAFCLTEFLFIFLWKVIKNRKICHRLMLQVLMLWILIQCIYVGVGNYSSYSANISRIQEAIERSVETDERRIREHGITKQMIDDVDGYLERYSENIPEIQKVHQKGDNLEFEISYSYLRRVFVDYIVQMLLFLAFSLMIVAEYKLYISNGTEVERNV